MITFRMDSSLMSESWNETFRYDVRLNGAVWGYPSASLNIDILRSSVICLSEDKVEITDAVRSGQIQAE